MFALLALATVLLAPSVHAQTVNVFANSTTGSAGIEQGASDTTIIVFRILKFVAVIAGGIGVWRIIEHDYKYAVACFVCFAVLFFMPTIVNVAQNMGASAYATSQMGG
jgi:hypothetical protein